MAEICTVICTSHSPYLFASAREWRQARDERSRQGTLDEAVPLDTPEENERKFQRCMTALATLRERLDAARPDVLLVFGDDQGEQFSFTNFPALGIFVGPGFEGYKVSRYFGLPIIGTARPTRPKSIEHWVAVKGHPNLARYLMETLTEDRFDLAFCTGLADIEEGMGHAFMRPSYYLRPDYDLPTVPFFINCYYAPQPTGLRCYQLGRAVRARIEAWDQDLRVAVIGSGGLWHTPGMADAGLDEEFNRGVLEAVRLGDARAMADHFDGWALGAANVSDRDTEAFAVASGGTGMRGGLGSGSGETRNWIAASAVADGAAGTVVDYVPVYDSPVGMAFAHWERP
ncbi:hypothetical protein [Pseudonocardia acaciae]|uniref:DODA-type extradiol aromatic ring-opening family dioxygenase n=1 Tax=Pseudonocardia acaciae TaxID=551276 RepID=UPI00048A6C5A|nr:hypothetical protein [Pseudonocardia acaciae]